MSRFPSLPVQSLFFVAALTTSFPMAAAGAETAAAPTQPQAQSQAQADPDTGGASDRRHAISLELLGRGLLYSFNYDYQLTERIALGAGASHYSLSAGSSSASAWIVPVYANYYFTRGAHRWFATTGVSGIFASGKVGDEERVSGSGAAGILGAGYEYRGESGFLFRAAPYAFVGKASGVWFGISLGYAI